MLRPAEQSTECAGSPAAGRALFFMHCTPVAAPSAEGGTCSRAPMKRCLQLRPSVSYPATCPFSHPQTQWLPLPATQPPLPLPHLHVLHWMVT